MPDGSIVYHGDIFKAWSMFWERTNGIKSWQYKGEQLKEKYKVLISANPKFKQRLTVSPEEFSLVVISEKISPEDREFIEDILQVRTRSNDIAIFLYLDYPKYVFPSWVRKPFSNCPVCMASVFGSPAYWLFVHFQRDAFLWSSHPYQLQWVTWPIFCISLSFINLLWAKKAEF